MYQLIQDLLKRPIAFHRVFASLMGCAAGGLFLSQLYYWSVDSKAHDPENFIYKTLDEWQGETLITRREWEKARQKLKSLGLLEEQRRGLNPQLWYRLDVDFLYETIVKNSQNPHDSGIVTSGVSKSNVKRQLTLDSPLPDAISDLRSISTESTDQRLLSDNTYTPLTGMCDNPEVFETSFSIEDPESEPCLNTSSLPLTPTDMTSTNNPSGEEKVPAHTTIIPEQLKTVPAQPVGVEPSGTARMTMDLTVAYRPDCDLGSTARFDRQIRTYQNVDTLTANLVEIYNRIKPEHWGKCTTIGVHLARQVASLLRYYQDADLLVQNWGEACLALKASDFYNSSKFKSGTINFLLDPTKPDRISQQAQAWRDRPQVQKEQLAKQMVAARTGIPRWENPDVTLSGGILSLRRSRYQGYVRAGDFENPECPSIEYLQTYFPEIFENA
jgi:hypothetical protein